MKNEKNIILETVSKFIQEIVNDESFIIEFSTPVEAIKFNSIDFIKLLVFIENEYDIEFDDDNLVLENYKTVEDLIDIISQLLN